jgi:hypothetical protein
MFLFAVFKKLVPIAAFVAVTLTWADPVTATSLKLSWQDTSTKESGFKVQCLIGATYAQIATGERSDLHGFGSDRGLHLLLSDPRSAHLFSIRFSIRR